MFSSNKPHFSKHSLLNKIEEVAMELPLERSIISGLTTDNTLPPTSSIMKQPVQTPPTSGGLLSNKQVCVLSFSGNHSSSSSKNAIYSQLEFIMAIFLAPAAPLLAWLYMTFILASLKLAMTSRV